MNRLTSNQRVSKSTLEKSKLTETPKLYYYQDYLSVDEDKVREYMAELQLSKYQIENEIGHIYDVFELDKWCYEYGYNIMTLMEDYGLDLRKVFKDAIKGGN